MLIDATSLFKDKLKFFSIQFNDVDYHVWNALKSINSYQLEKLSLLLESYLAFISSKSLTAYSKPSQSCIYFADKYDGKASNTYGGFKFFSNGDIKIAYSTRGGLPGDFIEFQTAVDGYQFCKPFDKNKRNWFYVDVSSANAEEMCQLNSIWLSSFLSDGTATCLVSGKIRQPSQRSMEISIKTLNNDLLKFKHNDGNEISLSILNVNYRAVLRHTDKNGYWISPFCFLGKEELKLIDVLTTAGFKKNDDISILFCGHDGRVIMSSIASIKDEHDGDVMIEKEKNQILFGPPGTGKTYSTVTEALDIIEPGIVECSSDGRGQLQYKFSELVKAQRIQFVTFHQSFSYEDFIEGIKAESQDGVLHYRVVDGLFKQICQRAEADPEYPYVLIIDEINRGNISRIFGELITLLEASKRLGAEEELKVVLPYSKQPFGVPNNLYLIGTMNTADRSLAGLDLALRRRFFFKEMPPRPELLDSLYVEGIQIGELLRTINRRITALLGRDYCLGHALFMPLQKDSNLQHLGRIFQKQVLPLLQEYFFEDWQKIALVLNDHRKSKGDRFVTQDEDLDLQTLFGEEAELGNLPAGWKIKPEGDVVWFQAGAYMGITAHNWRKVEQSAEVWSAQ